VKLWTIRRKPRSGNPVRCERLVAAPVPPVPFSRETASCSPSRRLPACSFCGSSAAILVGLNGAYAQEVQGTRSGGLKGRHPSHILARRPRWTKWEVRHDSQRDWCTFVTKHGFMICETSTATCGRALMVVSECRLTQLMSHRDHEGEGREDRRRAR
jgi:hypothetical protein